MGLFDFGKKKNKRVIDLTERYRKQQERAENIRRDMQTDTKSQSSESSGMFSIFGGAIPTVNEETNFESSTDSSSSPEDKRRRLTKRLLDMTTKIEEISNQIYHLTQRIEVLEKKLRVGEVE